MTAARDRWRTTSETWPGSAPRADRETVDYDIVSEALLGSKQTVGLPLDDFASSLPRLLVVVAVFAAGIVWGFGPDEGAALLV